MTNETVVAKVLGIETKEGTGKNDKKWKRYGIKLEPVDGSSNITVGTFDENDQKVIKAMVDENVKLEYKLDGDFKNLVKGSIKSARAEEVNSAKEAIPEEPVPGNNPNNPTRMSKDDFWKNKETRDIENGDKISRHGSLNTALEAIKISISTGCDQKVSTDGIMLMAKNLSEKHIIPFVKNEKKENE